MLVAAGHEERVLRWPTLSGLIGERSGGRVEEETEKRADHVAGGAVEIIAGQEEKWDKLGARRRPRRLRTPSPLWTGSSCVARIGYVDKYSLIYIYPSCYVYLLLEPMANWTMV